MNERIKANEPNSQEEVFQDNSNIEEQGHQLVDISTCEAAQNHCKDHLRIKILQLKTKQDAEAANTAATSAANPLIHICIEDKKDKYCDDLK